jgi:acetyl-CoA carboxylase biotin carboxyl carrier protein
MELKKLKEFIEFMKEHDLAELEVEEEGKRIKLKKNVLEAQGIAMPQLVPQAASQVAEAATEVARTDRIEIKSPMVGTFYRAASPGAKPFSEMGEVIAPGDVVCIIEAMKLMNEIKAEVGGRIVEIAVENGEPVEFGQTLFFIEPA